MIEEIRGKVLVITTKDDEVLELLSGFDFPVNRSRHMACIVPDTFRVFKVGEKYVLLNAENPDVIHATNSLEELEIWVLAVYWGLNETAGLVVKGVIKPELYNGNPWLDAGWQGGWRE